MAGVSAFWFERRATAHSAAAVIAALSLPFSACTQYNPAFSLTTSEASPDETGVGDHGPSPTSTSAGSHDAGGSNGSRTTGSDSNDTHAANTSDNTDSTDSADSTTHGTSVKHVFVTSQSYSGGDIGGLRGADEKCQGLAAEAGLEGSFRAWLSDGTGSPAERMSKVGGSYVLLDDRPVAADWSDLVSGNLMNAIDITETGMPLVSPLVCSGGEVWTNTRPDGTPRTGQNCDNWSSNQGASFTGYSTATSPSWTESDCINVTCSATLPLYCFEQ